MSNMRTLSNLSEDRLLRGCSFPFVCERSVQPAGRQSHRAAFITGQVIVLAIVLVIPAACDRPEPAPAPTPTPTAVVDPPEPLPPPAPADAPVPAGIAAARPGSLPVPPAATTGNATFENATARLGVKHLHRKGTFDRKLANIMPWISSIGSAVAIADVDGDGDLDFYTTNSRRGFPNALFLNQRARGEGKAPGPLHFVESAAAAGVATVNDENGVSMDASFGDLDNDGDPDLYIVEWGKNRLFRNDGSGHFVEITDAAGVGDRSNGNCVLIFDHDGDGDLDILVCNYFPSVDLWNLDNTLIMHDSFERARNGGANVLYRNDGDMRFTEVSHNLHLDGTGWSLDAGVSDIDNDGDLDLYIANDFGPDRMFLNSGDGLYLDITARSIGPDNRKGMNVDFGDFNADGFTDIYVANITTAEYLKEGNMLWLNGGDRTFTDVGPTTGTADGGWGWCGRFFDYDLDGDLDIMTVNGFVSAGREAYWDQLARVAVEPGFESRDARQWPTMGSLSLSGHETTRLFRNEGAGSFTDVAAEEGIVDIFDGRGIALADFDDDGDLDVVVSNQNQPLEIFLNRSSASQSWVSFRLRGTRSNRDAIGARAELVAGDLRLVREVNGVNGYASQSDLALSFGLGDRETVDRVTIFWPSGVVTTLDDLAARHHYVVEEAGEVMAPQERQKLYFDTLARRATRTGPGDASAVDTERARQGARLLALEGELRRRPRNPSLANRYRELAKETASFDRATEFFRGLVDAWSGRQAPTMLRLQLALAYIDTIPSAKGNPLSQASLAKESLTQLDHVIENKPECYSAWFVHGMNHLYWPASLRRAPLSIEKLEHCWKLVGDPHGGARIPGVDDTHRVELALALGDAHIKNKDADAARRVWDEALARFPKATRLAARRSLDDERLLRQIRGERGLDLAIDTSLAILIPENDLLLREKHILQELENREALNEYRREAAEIRQGARAVTFLQKLLGVFNRASEAMLHLAIATFDDLRGDDDGKRVDRERRIRRILELLAGFQERQPQDYLGHHLEAMVRLWVLLDDATKGNTTAISAPTGAVARPPEFTQALLDSLGRARELTARPEGTPRLSGPVILAGDALVMLGRPDEARATWKNVSGHFPGSSELASRITTAPNALPGLVVDRRYRATEIFTDLDPLLDLETELATFEAGLAERFERGLADRYRRLVRSVPGNDRGVRFLRHLHEGDPHSSVIRVQIALALLDGVSNPTLGSVEKGRLSAQALELLAPVAKAMPQSWGLKVLVGTIHLNWFTKLGHVPAAITALEQAVAIFDSEADETATPGASTNRGNYSFAYEALGDAHVKAHRFAVGRREWKRGQKHFPESPGLTERVGLTSLMVNKFVARLRSWDTVVDTDFFSETIGEIPPLPRNESP